MRRGKHVPPYMLPMIGPGRLIRNGDTACDIPPKALSPPGHCGHLSSVRFSLSALNTKSTPSMAMPGRAAKGSLAFRIELRSTGTRATEASISVEAGSSGLSI